MYAHELHRLLTEIPFLDCNSIDVQTLDNYIETINTAMHTAAQEAGGTPRKCFKPKPYWCPELTRLRNRKRFWWSLWIENGRPRTGAVFDCYKGIKKLYRKISRSKINNITLSKFRFIDSLFNERKMKSFWNRINAKTKRKVNSALDAQALADYFATTMTDTKDFNDDQSQISHQVATLYDENKNKALHKCFSDADIENAILALKHNVSCGLDGITAKHLALFNLSSVGY